MKIRIVGNKEEFELIMPCLQQIMSLFKVFNEPSPGTNKKYKNNNELLCYIEIDSKKLKQISQNLV